jgi:hypothetical protein
VRGFNGEFRSTVTLVLIQWQDAMKRSGKFRNARMCGMRQSDFGRINVLVQIRQIHSAGMERVLLVRDLLGVTL